MPDLNVSGSCLCGAVRITVKNINNKVGACHCGMCRKWCGGPLMAVNCGADVIFDGKDNVSVFDSSAWAERGFCSACGSHLYYRLKVVEVELPPLRERTEDIPALCDRFLTQLAERLERDKKKLSPGAVSRSS